ncbi:D-glycerate dehydrogenase [Mechercharimyces sp. CAU 1602]|uniref:2-hydroxyacid dehydrogenase n=1 Tax=Mechercharimyces sp. CAU 1602 TaxID=2973933 RepID=UPI002162E1B1|nr:D-glycerate dehydrogenase [Mechercharimyces sp. CAU 1602]MCS1350205.1 D-glycerate dehydrogenase [Mechercharimyces sp. CAU 1602]
MKEKVLVTRALPQEALLPLYEECEVEINPADCPLSQQDLITALRGKKGLLCTVSDDINAEVIAKAPHLQVISNYGVGYNNINIEEASSRGIVVTNTPDVLTETTADLTWALLLTIARRLHEGERLLRAGKWKGWSPLFLLGQEVTGARLGIIGFGRIGRAVARRAHAFQMNVSVYTRTPLTAEIEEEYGVESVSLDALLQTSDFITLHAPLTEETFHMIGRKQLQQMRSTSYLINTSRGPLLDEEALAISLQRGEIAGAALDVYEDEPNVTKSLLQLENVVLAPHLGSATRTARERMAQLAVANLRTVLRGERPRYPVNDV